MSEGDAKTLLRATEIVQRASTHGTGNLSPVDVATLVAAVVDDIVSADEKDEQRFDKLQEQTRVLSEAVIAITEPSPSVAPAIAAVKAKMSPALVNKH